MSCSPGLLWNGLKNECDFPENVQCDLSAGAIGKHKVVGQLTTTTTSSQVPTGTYIYMTFDDGPNEGTPYVLDALKEVALDILRLIS